MSLKKVTFFNYASQFYTIILNIIVMPLYLKHLGAESFGLIGFFTTLQAWFNLLDLGLSPTLTRESARLKNTNEGLYEYQRLLRSVEFVFFPIMLIIIVSITIASGWISNHWLNVSSLSLKEVSICIMLMGTMAGMRWYVGLYSGSIVGMEKQIWLSSYRIVINSFKYFGAYCFVKYLSSNPVHFFEYQFSIALIEIFVLKQKLYSLLPKQKKILLPSLDILKKILPFAISISYTSGLWIILTQIDKLLLSHYLPLNEFGYFGLVIVVSGAITQFSSPMNQVALPRMTSLNSQGCQNEMLWIYRKTTQFIAVIIFAVSGSFAVFGREVLFAWTGNSEAANWAAPILFWYALTNGILSLSALQYYLQYVHGNLKYHVRGSTIFGILQIIIIFIATVYYQAIGAAVSWFIVNLISFFIWVPFIHAKFAPPGMHKIWLLKDILPALLATSVLLAIYKSLNIDFYRFSRFEMFIVLAFIVSSILICNAFVSTMIRQSLINIFAIKVKIT